MLHNKQCENSRTRSTTWAHQTGNSMQWSGTAELVGNHSETSMLFHWDILFCEWITWRRPQQQYPSTWMLYKACPVHHQTFSPLCCRNGDTTWAYEDHPLFVNTAGNSLSWASWRSSVWIFRPYIYRLRQILSELVCKSMLTRVVDLSAICTRKRIATIILCKLDL